MKTGNVIREWLEEDQPREKLMKHGPVYLTNGELLAIILGSGSVDETAVELGQRILSGHQNSWTDLSKQSLEQLLTYKGIGPAKAVTMLACFEIARRKKANNQVKSVIKSSRDAFQYIGVRLEDLGHEEFWVLLLNRRNAVMKSWQASLGGVDSTIADPRLIVRKAIECSASGVILCHNHPSGNLTPSKSDIQLTKKLCKAFEFFDVKVLDHIIVGHGDYFSFADENML